MVYTAGQRHAGHRLGVSTHEAGIVLSPRGRDTSPLSAPTCDKIHQMSPNGQARLSLGLSQGSMGWAQPIDDCGIGD